MHDDLSLELTCLPSRRRQVNSTFILLREAKREKAFNHVFDKDQPLRRIKLTEVEKEALRRKIAGKE